MPTQPTRSQMRNSHRHRVHQRAMVQTTVTVVVFGLLGFVGTASTGHIVAKGETLSHIARRYGLTVSDIAATNGITNIHYVREGRSLTIGAPAPTRGIQPVPIAASLPTPVPPPASVAAMFGVHAVVNGETLSGIAKRYATTVSELASANNIVNVNTVRIGTQLMIPLPAPPPPPPSILDLERIPSRLKASPERMELAGRFEHWANTYGVGVDLVMGVAWVESGWQNHVISSVGAVGIGQIMPATGTWLSERIIKEPLDARDPDHNIRMMARYLRWLLDRTGEDVPGALAGYYQGLSSVKKSGLYPASQTYISAVLGATETYF